MKKIVIATKNQGKVREMRTALAALPVEVVALSDFGDLPEAVEDGTTFAENAKIKAEFYAGQTGCACIADDSGIEVEALGGAPGIHSARYAGYHADDETNNAKLIAELGKLGLTESPADYRCALVFVDAPDAVAALREPGHELETEGRCDGVVRVDQGPRGDGGFGYDPYFYVEAYPGHTIAEITLEQKDRISHRGAALRAMVTRLEEYLR